MSCKGCGGEWDGTSVYCPNCSTRTVVYGVPAPCAAPTAPTTLDRVLSELQEVTRLLRQIEYSTRTR